MSGLVRHLSQVPDDTRVLECRDCRAQWPLAVLGDDLYCPSCGTWAMIPRRREATQSKYPGELGDHFSTIPHALMNGPNVLGLDAQEQAVVIALDSFRWGGADVCWPSIERLVAMTKLADRTVRRAIGRLEGRGLLGVARARRRGTFTANVYDLRPFWQALADAQPKRELRAA